MDYDNATKSTMGDSRVANKSARVQCAPSI